MITIYNTLTRKKEELKPLEEGKIKMYVCGPTVYDVPHIGHARSAYIFNFIRSYFEYSGYEVVFVRNVTDVDDKIIKKASDELHDISEGFIGDQLKKRVQEVASRYLDIYHRELDILGIRPPTIEPKATETIPQMIGFIEKLIESEYAYVAGGDVYFSVEKFKDYGKLSGQDKDQMMHGVRIEVDRKKKYPLDFALWKEAKEGEPSWKSPWGDGRPGWHIECSVMSTNLLGKRFDIHGGGLDLIFPHHENEIAQSQAATGEKFANYWIHNGLLSVNGEKMSKSLGNFITISDFLQKYRDPDLLKIFFLNSHYRSPVDYSDAKIAEARHAKERIIIFFEKVDRLNGKVSEGEETGKDPDIAKYVEEMADKANRLKEEFDEAMNDDFNTPSALSVLFEAVHIGNEILSDNNILDVEKLHSLTILKTHILKLANVLGLSLRPVAVGKSEEEKIEDLVAQREQARKKKDYKMADKIRDQLSSMGITLEDTSEGPVWRKS